MASGILHSLSQRAISSSSDSSEAIIRNLVSASSAQNYDPAQLVAAHPIDAQLLQHENPNNCHDLAPGLPLDKYRLNVDQNPLIVRRKPQDKISYLQQVAVRYLQPPPPPRAGDIVIQELAHKQVAPAPALVVRQAPPKPATPPPIVLREAPPPPPIPLPGRLVPVPGKIIPPPARKVVVERLPPIPPKPQQVFIERWLPYGQQTQRVRYQPAPIPCVIPDPKNVVIQWESPDVEIHKEFRNLGIVHADPQEYVARYGQSLIRSDQLPDLAVQYAAQPGFQLAATHRPPEHPHLEGDLFALGFIDLESNGLGWYRNGGGISQHISSSSSQPIIQSAISHAAAYSSSPIQSVSISQPSPVLPTFTQATPNQIQSVIAQATTGQSAARSASHGSTVITESYQVETTEQIDTSELIGSN